MTFQKGNKHCRWKRPTIDEEEKMRRAAKTDANQAEIVKALRSCGAKVILAQAMGSGFPDLICWGRGRTFFVEVKLPGEKLNKLQVKFIAAWPGELHVVHSPEQAVNALVGA